MSSYINHYRRSRSKELGWQVDVSWAAISEQRLRWLYGPDHAATRAAQTRADLDAWRNLGRRTAA